MTLAAHHHTMLHTASAIADAVIEARGYRSLDRPAAVEALGFPEWQARSAKAAPVLVIPLWDVHGKQSGWQLRPDRPRKRKGEPVKYETMKGSRLSLDVHPSVQPLLGNPQVPLWVTEGVKKGDALASAGACAVALMGGVDGFRGTNEHGGKTILPEWEHIALNGRRVIVVYDSDFATNPNVQRAQRKLCDFLRYRQALPTPVVWPEAYQQKKWGVDDFLADHHTLGELLAMATPSGPVPPAAPPSPNGTAPAPIDPNTLLTDHYNARALVDAHGPILRYCKPWKCWLIWTGTHWQRDASGEVLRYALQAVKGLAARLPILDKDEARQLLNHIKSSLSTARLKAMLEQAQVGQGIPVQPEELDLDPWLLNCTNGTLDLHTGELRKHNPADLITRCLDVPYTKDAPCPEWLKFLWRIMGGTDPGKDTEDDSALLLETRQQADTKAREMIDFLQRAIGYSLTGSTREQCLFILYGITKTGKSTFVATLRTLLGPYGTQADMETFMHKDRQEVRNDLADLAGARLVCAVESQQGRRLNENLIKQLTGGVDEVKARFLFQEHFVFKPQFKVFLGTNHKPAIRDPDDAIWERIRLIPFEVQIPLKERKKALDVTLAGELSGILTWALKGCLEWQALDDLKPPGPVTAATKEYQQEMDVVARFLEKECDLGTRPDGQPHTVANRVLHRAYQQWAGGAALSERKFRETLEEKGYVTKREESGMCWQGIGLPGSFYASEDKKSLAYKDK